MGDGRSFGARASAIIVLYASGCSLVADRDDYTFGEVDAGMVDAALDALAPDAPATTCTSDDDCDALPNAAVVCEAGRCVVSGCREGFGDCDGVGSNGCETSLDDDVRNCGSCGNACTYAQAQARCTAQVCELGPCRDGFDNCDGRADNGCEADLRSAGACGACGVSCTAPTPLCDSSTARVRCVERCEGEATLCGTQCVDTRDNPRHCGSCDVVCPDGPEATPVCTGTPSACGFRCDEGYGDCTADAGCETDLRSSLAHCGACGNACAGQNASWACVASACGVVACDVGFADCDAASANGCEVDLTSDATSCGACGRACAAGEHCVGGACDPVVGGAGDEYHTCLVRDGGRAYCFGDNEFEQIAGTIPRGRFGPPSLVTHEDGSPFLVRDIAPSGQATCAIARGGADDGRIFCWGRHDTAAPGVAGLSTWPRALEGPTGFEARRFRALSGLFARVCALDTDGDIWCWGLHRGDLSAFPAGSALNGAQAPQRLALPVAARQIALGYANLCYVGTDARAYCRGNRSGNGNDDASDRDVFAAVAGIDDLIAIDTMRAATCALRRDGQLFCWGFNGHAQLGLGDVADRATPQPVLDEVERFVMLDRATCAACRDTSVWCWGEQRNGAAASGSVSDVLLRSPQRVDDLPGNASLRDGTAFVRAPLLGCVARPGAPVCWGSNGAMAMGTSERGMVPPTPLALPAASRVTHGGVGLGQGPSGGGCVRLDDETVHCFGQLRYGIAGGGDTQLRWAEGTPTLHPELMGAAELSVGTGFACAIRAGLPICWGLNNSGRLGRISPVQSATPLAVTVPAGHGARGVSAGNAHACAILTGGARAGDVWCWGSNANGRLGRDPASTGAVADPGAVEGLPGPADAVVTTQTATFVLVGGQVHRLGSITGGADTFVPIPITQPGGASFTGVSQISGGRFHACAIVSASPSTPGPVFCWGNGGSGQLGGGTSGADAHPVTGVTDARSVAAAHGHSCAALASGMVSCWGDALHGERTGLGVSGLASATPTLAAGLTNVVRVLGGTFGARRMLAIRSDGSALCWGENLAGGCGVGEPMRIPTALPVLGIPGLEDL